MSVRRPMRPLIAMPDAMPENVRWVDNAIIARIFAEMADVREIRGDNVFKIRAFRNAAAAIETLPFDVCSVAAESRRLREIEGIGESMARKIQEICETGVSQEHQQLLSEFPTGLLEILQVQGLGPKKVRLFHAELGVRSVADLAEAARAGRIQLLPRMSAVIEQKLLRAIEEHNSRTGRFLLPQADQAAGRIRDMLRSFPAVVRCEVAGSLRRRRETVGNLDLLVSSDEPEAVFERFGRAGLPLARAAGEASIRLSSGIRADLRVVPDLVFGAAFRHFTGSRNHNLALETLAAGRGLTIHEHGLVRPARPGDTSVQVQGLSKEEEAFDALGITWIPPELREDRGEVQAALAGRLPRLIELEEIRGDVHMHTTATDGTASIEEMAEAAASRGHGYIAITDHSRALAMARGLDEAALRRQAASVALAQRTLGDRIRIFSGVEVDILQDGRLDLSREALAEVDVVIGSVHSHFQLPRDQMTARVVRAIESGCIDILGHPTGRKLLRRDAYALDLERVLQAAAERGVALEVSATPDRLDLSDDHCRMAKQLGVKLAINTDAHAPSQLDFMRFGVANARRGWLEAADVVNTREADEFSRLLHDGHR